MERKSRQSKAEQEKTISITEARKLRLKILKPHDGLIEIVNSKDNGRVCTLKIDDFNSLSDTEAYAELLKLAPELLDIYLSDAKTHAEVVVRFEKKVARSKKNPQKLK